MKASRCRATVRRHVISTLHRLGAFARLRRRNRGRVTIVQYHGVTTSRRGDLLSFRKKHVEATQFAGQMRWLRDLYNVVPLERIVAHYLTGVPLPEYCAAITFDDGFRNNYTVAYPVLQELSLPATIFVPTDFVSGHGPLWLDRIEYAFNTTPREHLALEILGVPVSFPLTNEQERAGSKRLLKNLLRQASPALIAGVVAELEAHAGVALGEDRDAQGDYAPLTWDELSEMQGSRLVSVGSHTVTHPILPQCSAGQVDHELQRSKSVIEDILGRGCNMFCYPNGDFDPSIRAAVGRAGYAGAVCSRQGLNDGSTDLLTMKRIGVPGTVPLSEFAALVSGSLFLLSGARARLTRRS